eukprot:scaffold4599_cov219-Amphora_coffeaeformis.AAC.17
MCDQTKQIISLTAAWECFPPSLVSRLVFDFNARRRPCARRVHIEVTLWEDCEAMLDGRIIFILRKIRSVSIES